MGIAFITLIILLGVFAVLAMFDGVYLHLIRYKLYAHPESRAEHLSHTLRALLFPAILYFLYLGTSGAAFAIGLALVLADIAVLGADAYMEKDSRAFMGGLPRWEYILHLMVNGFHFASIAVFLVIKLRLSSTGVSIVRDFEAAPYYSVFTTVAAQLIPGAVLLGLLHIALLFPKLARFVESLSARIKCCGAHPKLQ